MIKQTPQQLAVCSWSTQAANPQELAQNLQAVGLSKVQLALVPLRDKAGPWANCAAVLKSHGIEIVSGMFGTVGEDYSTLDAIRRTGGIVPDATWQQNWLIIQDVVRIADELGLKMISSHIGFIPGESNDPQHQKLVDRVARIGDLFARHGLVLLFETGQERAEHLSQFLQNLDEAGATNTGVNFDPANMLLYNMGDPVVSLKRLMPRVKQVHIKDAIRTRIPGTWGQEMPVGRGQVNWKTFLATLAEGNYQGNLVIEREAGASRVDDIRAAVSLLSGLMQ